VVEGGKTRITETYFLELYIDHFQGCFILTLLGIIRCDMIAESIIAAAAEIGPLEVPIVVRLQGTNSEAGLKLVSLAPC
jgi:succinyl-CoA synthetase beta subunit